MERLNIGIDLDGVIANSAPVILDLICAHFRPGFSFKERGLALDGRVSELGVSVEELLEYVAQLWTQKEFHQQIKPVRGALKGIHALCDKGYGIHVLSHRPETVKSQFDVRNLSYSWLCENGFGHYLTSLILNPDHLDRNFKVRKAKDLNLDIYVEDEVDEAEKFAEAEIKVVFFDPDSKRVSLSGEVVIANSWQQIVCQIEKFSQTAV